MPLPPALAARLAKRGILSQKKAEPEEEVFAESYDDQDDGEKGHHHRRPPPQSAAAESLDKRQFMGYPGCPNKWNVYHECTLFCQHHWGSGTAEGNADSDYKVKHRRLMDKLGPLPDGWQEKYDPGTGRHFFWCTRTNRVSWLPPGHPKANITEAASKLREIVLSQLASNLDDDDDDDDDEEDEEEEEEEIGNEGNDDMELDSEMDSDSEDRALEERRRREKDKRREEKDKYRKGRRSKVDDLDPMDPAAYSDVPRGTWGSGLTEEGAKTGVDSTVSGPLFQQRPYPSPGAILRANVGKKK